MLGSSNIQVLKQLLRPIVLKRDNLRRKAGRRDAWTNKFSQDVRRVWFLQKDRQVCPEREKVGHVSDRSTFLLSPRLITLCDLVVFLSCFILASILGHRKYRHPESLLSKEISSVLMEKKYGKQ